MQNSVSFSGDWQQLQFSQCIDKISIKHKVKQKEYLDSGNYPVIDQSQSFISGYCNDEIAIKITKPVIVFGDHTRCFKFVDFDFVAGADGIHILEPKDFFNEKLFYYFCLALDFPNKGYSRHYQYLAKTTMKIPPLEIQRRIVKRLDEAFSRIESGTKHLKSAKDNLTKYKQSLLKSAFNGTLTQDCPLSQGESTHLTHPLAPSAREGEQEDCHTSKVPSLCGGDLGVGSTHTRNVVDCHKSANADSRNDDKDSLNGESANLPQGWTIKTLGEVCEKISAGGDRPNDCTAEKTQENQIPIFSNGIENNGLYGYTKTPTITKPALTISARGTIGFVCVRYEPFFPIVRLICAIPNDKVLVLEFLAYALRYLIPQGEGSSIPQLTIPNFKQIKIPIPPLETQRQIVAILERHFTSADKVSVYIDSCLSKAKQLKSSLLKSAFAGELT